MIGQPFRALLAFCSMGLVAASCANDRPGVRPSVDVGSTWTAVNVTGATPDRLEAPRVQFTVSGRIQGTTGCSDFSGEVRIERNAIAVGGLVPSGPAGEIVFAQPLP